MTECDVLIVGGGIVGLYLARSCTEKGLRVCVIEKGGDANGEPETSPQIHFSSRKNLAAIEARNHILGGNSRFWGGALVEDDGALITALGISGSAVAGFSQASDFVYSKIGIRRTIRLKSPLESKRDMVLCEFPVLTGKWRNIWSSNSRNLLENGVICFLNSILVSVEKTDRGKFALIKNAQGEENKINFGSMVVSAGVVDSIRTVSGLFPDLSKSGNSIGVGMNDHLSLPVISFPWKRSPILDKLFPPRFDNAVTVGRRLEFELPNSGVKGFFHLQAPYDDVEPYRSLKKLVFARQRGLSLIEVFGAVLSLLGGGGTTLRVGLDRYLAKRLFYPEGSPVNLLVDIESDSASNKSISMAGEFVLSWSHSEADRANLKEASLLALELLGKEILDDAELIAVRQRIEADSFNQYVEEECLEALHLGGGLQNILDPLMNCGLKCKLKTDFPVYVISTAIFPRAGVANPVHTLLVCSELLAQQLARE